MIINSYRDYTIFLSEAKYKAEQGKGFKMLTPKQMLLRLPVALPQVKEGYTPENLLNEIK